MQEITLSGRTATNDYFQYLDGLLRNGRLTHTLLLAFICAENSLKVSIIDNYKELLALEDTTPVMAQWRGEWRSDFFKFTVGDYRNYVDDLLKPYKTAYSVVKTVDPQGGFRNLAYTYMDESGISHHCNNSSKQEAARLEAYFVHEGIPVQEQREK